MEPRSKDNNLLLFLIIILVTAGRLYTNFSPELMVGVNTPYYPVQIRSLLQTGNLGFPDLPLTFYLEAFLAKILILFGLCNLTNCIMISWKIIDAVLFPLIAIPVYLLTKSVAQKINTPRWVTLLPAILALISFPTWIMLGELQKNSIGLLWSVFFFYFFYQGISQGKVINYLSSGIFFVLTGLTHLGAFGFVLISSFSLLFFAIILNREKRLNIIKMLALILAAVSSMALFLVFIDPERFGRLFSVIALPLKIFQQPMILQLFKDPASTILFYFMNPMGINANLIAVLGLILIFRKRQEIEPNEKILLIGTILVTFFMGSPFLGSEWAQRLYLMAYIPTIIVFIFLLKYTASWWKRVLLTALMLIVTSLPTPMMLASGMKSTPSINKEAYNHLVDLRSLIADPEKTLIIARHGLEWWTAWVLEVDVSQRGDFPKEILESYDAVYFLRQKQGKGQVGPPGPGSQFPEVEIPPGAVITHEDEYFILAKIR